MDRPGERLLSTLMEPWISYGGRLKVTLFPNPAKDFLDVKVKVSQPFHKGGVLTIYDEDDLKKMVVFIQLGENRIEIQRNTVQNHVCRQRRPRRRRCPPRCPDSRRPGPPGCTSPTA